MYSTLESARVRIATFLIFIFVVSVRASCQNSELLDSDRTVLNHIDTSTVTASLQTNTDKADDLNWFQRILNNDKSTHSITTREPKVDSKPQNRLVLLLQDIPQLDVDYNQLSIAGDKHVPCHFNAISCYGRNQ